MRNFILIQKWTILIFVILTVLQETRCDPHFTCPTMDGEDVPELPNYYTTHVRLNYFDQQKTVDVRQVVSKNEDGHKTAVEFSADQRHVKYIHYDNQLLIVTFYSDKNPTCVVKDTSSLDKFLEDEDAGPNMILSKLVSVVEGPLRSQLKISDVFNENGVSGRKWEGCFKNPEINVSLSFTENVWKQGHTSRLHKGKYIVSAEAQIDKNYLVALFNYFDPVMPADTEFQPPENVYCEGFRKDKKPPSMPNYFSYDSEVISYRSSMGVAPISTHLTVYYDYPAGIARSDFYDALAEDQDMFSEVSAKGISIIHDFNAGIQYLVDPIIGSCTIDEMEATISPADVQVTGDNKMPTGMEFFSLNVKGISYNGQFETRGYTADVYTALVETTINDEKKKLIYSWYFSTDLVDIVEKESVEKKVLLRMVVQPEAADGKEGEVDVNIFNFEKEEPKAFMYDLTSCYNESYSKNYVLTFPANDLVRDTEKDLRNPIHQTIKSVTEVSKQRIFISEVVFSGKYMYAEFKILARPDVLKKSKTTLKESTLDEAVEKLKAAVSANKFIVPIMVKDKEVFLKPEPDGLNEFAGDRRKVEKTQSYKEGSVIALTIGMLVLGFVLGGVTLNLVVSRKFGVSLFQRRQNRDPFSNSAGESSM